MISAADAFTLADSYRTEIIKKELEELERLIRAEAKKGNFECDYYGYLKPVNVEKLKELGYKVEIEEHYGESNVHINWAQREEEKVKTDDENGNFKHWLCENY